MNQWTAETQAIINTHSVTAKTYQEKVGSVGFGTYVKSLGGVFSREYGKTDQIKTVQQLQDRAEYVAGLMSIFRFCYWNGKTWWFWLNSKSKAFYSSAVKNKGCRGGTIGQLCQGTDGRLRITCCNYGVDTLLRQCGIYSLKKTTVKQKSKLQPGDVIDLYKASTGKWHHQIIVHSIENNKIWCLDFGNRFIRTGKPLHYMSKTGTSAGGEYGNDKWAGRHRITLKKEESVPMLNGIDIASYQQGINLATVPGDFVIVKVTQGTYYKNPAAAEQIKGATGAGKLLGLYHYAAGGDPVAEADYFLAACSGYIGKAVLCLDWEHTGNSVFGTGNSVAWVQKFMERVHSKTDVWPLLYCQQSEVLARDWAPVAKNCGLWLAQYAVASSIGYNPHLVHGALRSWGAPAIWQYTSGGDLSGWPGRLDLNVAYMTREAWKKYASPAGSKEETEDIPVPKTVKQGSSGKAVKVLQAALGNLTIDGKAGPKTVAAIKAFQKKKGLKEDGVCGPVTWRAVLSSLS